MSRIKAILIRGLDFLVGIMGCILFFLLGPVIGLWIYKRNSFFPLVPVVLVGTNRRQGNHPQNNQLRNRRHVVMPGRLINTWRFQGAAEVGWSGFSGWTSLVAGLPLFWNLLRGDLTLFGPQPVLLTDYLRLKGKFPDRIMAPVVKPGLMGLSQLDDDPEGVPGAWLRRRDLDRRYVARRTLLLDLQILFFTLLEFLPGGRG